MEKLGETTQVNTFFRLGNGYAAESGALYDSVEIDSMIISLQLGEWEYMVTINEDQTITVVGDAPADGAATKNTIDIEKEME